MMVSNTHHSGSTFTHILKSSPAPVRSLSINVARCYRIINCTVGTALPSRVPSLLLMDIWSCPILSLQTVLWEITAYPSCRLNARPSVRQIPWRGIYGWEGTCICNSEREYKSHVSYSPAAMGGVPVSHTFAKTLCLNWYLHRKWCLCGICTYLSEVRQIFPCLRDLCMIYLHELPVPIHGLCFKLGGWTVSYCL